VQIRFGQQKKEVLRAECVSIGMTPFDQATVVASLKSTVKLKLGCLYDLKFRV